MKKLTITIAVFILFVFVTSAYSAAPANDMFANPIIITGTSGTTNGNNIDSTIETGEPEYGNESTVWWTWTAPSSGGCEFNTFFSDYDTYLAVFTGNSVSSLTTIATNDDSSNLQSKVCFEVSSGQTYLIQVSGYGGWHYNEGNIILNWQLGGPFGDWIFDYSYTDILFKVRFAYDLSVLSYEYKVINNEYYRTNNFGCEIWKTETFRYYTNGFSITDKNEIKKVENKPLEGIGNNTYIEDYNGKQVLVYNWDNIMLVLYGVKKDVFVKIGEQEIKNFYDAWFEGSEIYIELENDQYKEGLKVFDKKLAKEKWADPLANGYLDVVSKGLTAREVWTGDVVTITYRKKGKKIVSEHSLTEPTDYRLEFITDKKGGVLYWTRISITNSPLTYLDRKGKKIVDNKSMTDVGNFWSFESFDGKTLYVSKENNSSNYVFYAYKLKGMKKLEQQNIVLPQNGNIYRTYFGKKTYIIPKYKNSVFKNVYGAYIFDKKLKKEQWKEDYAEGSIQKIGKDTLGRYTKSKVGDTITRVYKLFNKNGEIVTYTFEYDE